MRLRKPKAGHRQTSCSELLNSRLRAMTAAALSARSDYQLGRQIAGLLQQTGDLYGRRDRGESELIRRLPDLLGSDPSLLNPLRDLLQRPELRRLLREPYDPQLRLQGRDHLIAELQLTYSNRIAGRLQHTLNGILLLADAQAPPAAAPAGGGQAYGPSVTYTVQTGGSGQGGLTAVAIALLALVSGGALVALIWMLMHGSQSGRPLASPSPTPGQASSLPQPAATRRLQSTPPGVNSWGRPEDYKFGQGPSANFPHTCAFSRTDARGATTLADKSQLEFWACRDEGGDPENGYAVTWGDGKRTVYRFNAGGVGAVVGTNGQEVAIQWRNDQHNGADIIVINHRDGATSWIPGSVGD